MGTNFKPWSAQEREHLKAFYPAISAQKLTELITDRSAQAIKQQAHRMDVRKCHERLREMGAENIQKRWHPPEIQA